MWPWRDGRAPRSELYMKGSAGTQIVTSADGQLRQTSLITIKDGKQQLFLNRKEQFDASKYPQSVYNFGVVPSDESKGKLYAYTLDQAGHVTTITEFDQPKERLKGDTIVQTNYVWLSNKIVRMEEVNRAHVWGKAVTTYIDLVWADSINPEAAGFSLPTPADKLRPQKYLLSYRSVTIFNDVDSLIQTVKHELDAKRRVVKTVATERHATKTASVPVTVHTSTYVYFDDNVIQHWEVHTQSRSETKQSRGQWRERKFDASNRLASQEMWVFENYGPKGRWVKQEKIVFEY